MKKIPFYTFLTLLVTSSISMAQNNLPLVTYGSEASILDGDDDFKQVIFFKIPESVVDRLYLRVFDIDCGGRFESSRLNGWPSRGGCSASRAGMPLEPAQPVPKFEYSGSGQQAVRNSVTTRALSEILTSEMIP